MVDAHFDDDYADYKSNIVSDQCETCSKIFQYELDFAYEHLIRDTNTNELVTCCHDCLNQDY